LTADCTDDADVKDLEPFGFLNRRKRRERRPERLCGSSWLFVADFLSISDFDCHVTVLAGLNLFGVWTFEFFLFSAFFGVWTFGVWDFVRRSDLNQRNLAQSAVKTPTVMALPRCDNVRSARYSLPATRYFFGGFAWRGN
jgi:hypothetical protein